ncbi:MAG: CDP-archaeol synthase [Chloroflexi bacterium]|nr:CDP-archaeol synthase [Chloroflexota bacterium]
MKENALLKRVLAAAVATPLLVAAIWFDRPLPWFTLAILVWGFLAVLEFYRLAALKTRPLLFFGTGWTLLLIASPHFTARFPSPFLLTAAILLSLVLLMFRRHKEELFTAWTWSISGILYTGWLAGYLVALRLDYGPLWVLLALLVTFASDSAAFLVGRRMGRHKLAPHISPGKTWEGAVGGAIAGAVAALLVAALLNMGTTSAQAAVFGLLVSVSGQFGDLAESMLKRTAGVKESGKFMPGHGGALDRIDSLLFSGVVAYYFAMVYNNGWLNWM